MIDRVMVAVSNHENVLSFLEANGTKHIFYHEQDCCESVTIEDICGELTDLVGAPILMAEKISGKIPEIQQSPDLDYNWTFYKFATIKGSVTIRWLGTSNGFYSTSVNYRCIPNSELLN